MRTRSTSPKALAPIAGGKVTPGALCQMAKGQAGSVGRRGE